MPDPSPPRLPRDFTWTGRYEVPDLGVELPFSWHGNAGNLQMIIDTIEDDPGAVELPDECATAASPPESSG